MKEGNVGYGFGEKKSELTEFGNWEVPTIWAREKTGDEEREAWTKTVKIDRDRKHRTRSHLSSEPWPLCLLHGNSCRKISLLFSALKPSGQALLTSQVSPWINHRLGAKDCCS